MSIKPHTVEAIRSKINRAATRYTRLTNQKSINAHSELLGLMILRLELWEAARLMPEACWQDHIALRNEMLSAPAFH